MGYRKVKESNAVVLAKKRRDGMIVIDEARETPVEYGDETKPCNTALITAKITAYDADQSILNQMLSDADTVSNRLKNEEKEIKSLHRRALSGAVSKFGEDSNEVEMMGGTRSSERKKRVSKPKLA